jgi:hypothetical protein
MWFDVGGNNLAPVIGAWYHGVAPIVSLVLGVQFMAMVILLFLSVVKELTHIGSGSVGWGFSSGGFGRAAGTVAGWAGAFEAEAAADREYNSHIRVDDYLTLGDSYIPMGAESPEEETGLAIPTVSRPLSQTAAVVIEGSNESHGDADTWGHWGGRVNVADSDVIDVDFEVM